MLPVMPTNIFFPFTMMVHKIARFYFIVLVAFSVKQKRPDNPGR
jgi:hypothetical protein